MEKQGKRMLKEVRLSNFLSFGPHASGIELKPLNILVGANGSGKSNFIESLALLKTAPFHIADLIRDGGGVKDWIYKGPGKEKNATIEIVTSDALRYRLSFTASGTKFEIVDEVLECESPGEDEKRPCFFYKYENNHPVLNVRQSESGHYSERPLKWEDIDSEKSILAQRKDPDAYPALTKLGEYFSDFRLYRNWTIGRYTSVRMQQPADLSNKWIDEDARNLGLVLSKLLQDYATKQKLLNAFRSVYDGAKDFGIDVESGNVQIYGQEEGFTVPATRLSDGTLHYLFLMAILYDPNPPSLIVIEEPELGLHPDLIPDLADALRDASERTQVVVSTHSAKLIDCFSKEPDCVIVVDRKESSTVMQRLDGEKLSVWLEKYSLGTLWTRGDLGGVRW